MNPSVETAVAKLTCVPIALAERTIVMVTEPSGSMSPRSQITVAPSTLVASGEELTKLRPGGRSSDSVTPEATLLPVLVTLTTYSAVLRRPRLAGPPLATSRDGARHSLVIVWLNMVSPESWIT